MTNRTLLFVRQQHVYLPEIPAYKAYLAQNFPDIQIFESSDFDAYDPRDFDVVWHFMGTDTKAQRGAGGYVIHEYNSLSTQPFAHFKNRAKRFINARPDARVFLNETVRDAFGFNDGVRHGLRDMGVDPAFFDAQPATNPDYDFVYAGGLDRGAVITEFLDYFSTVMKDATLLLVGDAPGDIRARYKTSTNITFKGRVPYLDVPENMANARYGLNIMPDIAPFNIQTATKVLEYCAIGLPVVTTDYAWISQFESAHNANCFKLSPNMSNLSIAALAGHNFSTPDISHLSWDRVIAASGIFDFLKEVDA